MEWIKTTESSLLQMFDESEQELDKGLYKAFIATIDRMINDWSNIHFNLKRNDIVGQLKDGSWQQFDSLSDGYRNIIRLSADIAYRAIKLNPHLGKDAVIMAKGVVLIDEIDMHLHPKWQRTVIEDLREAFPNIQFIYTTHSPFIIQSLKAEEIINLDGNSSEEPYVKSIEEIAETIMNIDDVKRSKLFIRYQETAAKYFSLIKEGKSSKTDNQTDQLKIQLDKLELEFSNDPVYIALMKSERKSESDI